MIGDLSILNLNILITLLCWSVWGIFDKKALESAAHVGVLFRLYVMALWEAPLVIAYVQLTTPHWHISSGVWFWTLLAAVVQVVALASYLVAMSVAEASMVLGVTAAYPLVTQFLSYLFLQEHIVLTRAFGAAAIACGVAAIGASQNPPQLAADNPLQPDKRLLLAVCVFLATFGWGIWGILDKKALEFGKPVEAWIAECVWDLVILLVVASVAYLRGYRVDLSDRKSWWFAFLSSVTLAFGRMTFLGALAVSTASYVIAITGCYPLLMYVLALAFLKERFNKVRLFGILFVVAGGIAVQITQSQ